MYHFQDLKFVQLLCTIVKISNLFSYCEPFSRSQACSVIVYYFLKPVQLLCTIFKILNLFSYCVPFSRSQTCSVIVYIPLSRSQTCYVIVNHFQDLKHVQLLCTIFKILNLFSYCVLFSRS